LGVLVVYQALPSRQGRDFQKKIGWLFSLCSRLNILWLFCWQFENLTASFGIMFLLLACLALIYIRVGVGKAKVVRSEKLAVHLPFSVYLARITLATVAKVATTLVAINCAGFGIAPEDLGNSYCRHYFCNNSGGAIF
jgi:hypothetical protein